MLSYFHQFTATRVDVPVLFFFFHFHIIISLLFYWFVSNKLFQAKRLLRTPISSNWMRFSRNRKTSVQFCVMDFLLMFSVLPGAAAAADGCFCVYPRDLFKGNNECISAPARTWHVQLNRFLSGHWGCVAERVGHKRFIAIYCFYFEAARFCSLAILLWTLCIFMYILYWPLPSRHSRRC